jgi:hypothetical protein
MARRHSFLDEARAGLAAGLLAGCCLLPAGPVMAQSGPVPAKVAESGPRWAELTPAQRAALKPLERDWASIEADRKQ